MNANINGREFTVTKTEAIEGALAADMNQRGYEATFYTMAGKRGASILAVRSIKTGQFSKMF